MCQIHLEWHREQMGAAPAPQAASAVLPLHTQVDAAQHIKSTTALHIQANAVQQIKLETAQLCWQVIHHSLPTITMDSIIPLDNKRSGMASDFVIEELVQLVRLSGS